MLQSTWQILVHLAPWLLFGTLIAGLLHVLVPTRLIQRRFRGKSGVIQAVVLGVPLPLCSCGVIPAGMGLKKDGASDGAAVGFLISTPQTGVDSILVSASFLGWPFAIFKVIAAAITGVIGGFLAERGTSTADPPAPDRSCEPESRRGFAEFVSHSEEVIHSIWLWVAAGVLVSALIDVYVPDEFFGSIGELGSFPAALVTLLISLPLYVCATASVPIAATLVAKGLPAGAALVFLMAGPATNVATIGAIFATLGRRVAWIYLSTIIGGSILFAVAFDWLLPAAMSVAEHAHHEHLSWWGQASAVILVVLFVRFAWQDLNRRFTNRGFSKSTPSSQESIRVEVKGMTCNGCVHRLESALRKTEGIESAIVRLEPGEAIVQGSIPEQDLRERIRETGFEPVSAK